MTTIGDFFIGPAVVVDDKIGQRADGMLDVLEQIAAAGMPVVTRTELPPDNEIDHWGGFSLIVLDWELMSVDEELAGIAAPEGLSRQNAAAVAEFVEKLLKKLYSPIFILSNEDVDEIRQELADRLQVVKTQVESRVLVRAKSAVANNLFEVLNDWMKSHPAVYALKRWELGYAEARRQMFHDFELGSTQWPRILWKTSKADGTNPHFELSETISRNILHRFEPLVFDDDSLDVEGDWPESRPAVRMVVHRNAVVDQNSLHDDVIMPGDFFAVEGKDSTILINVTPACDLVARKGANLDDVPMILLEGELLGSAEFSSKSKREKLRSPDGAEIIWVLRSDGRPYRFLFKSWRSAKWGDHKSRRKGRLLEPYITLLQQRFALHFHRQGLPRLPELFFDES